MIALVLATALLLADGFVPSEARNTRALQARIDAVSAQGGGTVRVTGEWTVASLKLKDGVTLRLEEGARLVASTNYADYVHTSGENRGAVVFAEDASRVAIEGRGVIDGRGGDVPRVGGVPGRWRGVVLTRCRDVRIEDVTIRNAHSWGCYLKECDGVVVRRLKVVNHVNHNNDGLDIASKNVLVEDCDIDSEDDGICLKNFNPDFVVENVRVRNCRVSSNSSFLKIGTETFGGFRDIDIRDCELSARVPISVREDYLGLPGVDTLDTGGDGIAIQTVDGGFIDGVTVRGIRMKHGFRTPIAVRLDRRRPRADGNPTYLRNVLIEDVTMEEPTSSWIASSITGASGLRPENVTVRNVTLRPKACTQESAAWLPVPESAGRYPSGRMFGVPTPAQVFFVRHADGIRLENVRVLPSGGDPRPPVVFDDAEVTADASLGAVDLKTLSAVPKPGRESLVGNPAWDLRFDAFKSSVDGSYEPYFWYSPTNRAPVPLVVVLHSWSRDCFSANPAETVADYCKRKGWAMVYPNFRGPNRRPEACGSDLAVRDVLDCIARVRRKRPVDPDRIYVIGGSGGGHMALLLVGRHPEVFAAAAAFCPITDLARWQNDSALRKNRYARDLVACCGGLPSDRADEYARRSPLAWLPRARAAALPVYIATGIHDGHTGSVPVGHAIRAYNALADERDRISEADIASIETTKTVPTSRRFADQDPFYGQTNRVWLRATSASVRLTLFEGGHNGNYPAGLDFLSRQRRGRKVDGSLPRMVQDVKIEAVTK